MSEKADNTNGQTAFWFDGFFEPSFTPVPDVLFDALAPNLSESELRVALYIMRRTFGFKKHSDAISINQLIGGITTRDGRMLDSGTGMSRQGVMRGVKGLEVKGVITVRKDVSEDGVNQINLYSLRFRPQGVVYERDYGSLPSRPGVVTDVDPQETVKQNTEDSNVRKIPTEKFVGKRYDATRGELVGFIGDFAREFRDSAPLSSSVTRAVNSYRASGLDLDAFIAAMMEARGITKERTSGIRAGDGGRKSMMGYFFAVLQDLTSPDDQRRA